MSYKLGHLKIDIGGRDGNACAIVAKAANIVRQVEGKKEANRFSKECFSGDYEHVLRTVIDKTGVKLVSNHKLPYPSELYTVEPTIFL